LIPTLKEILKTLKSISRRLNKIERHFQQSLELDEGAEDAIKTAMYRKKIAVLEAYRYDRPLYENEVARELPDWLIDARINGTARYINNELTLVTREGRQFVSKGDYIIMDEDGKLSVCKPGKYECIEKTP
jgi:hypothetical protein